MAPSSAVQNEDKLSGSLTERIISELEEGPLTAAELACILEVDHRRVRGMLFHLYRSGRVNKVTVKRSRGPRGGRVLWVGVGHEMPTTACNQQAKSKRPTGSGVVAGPLLIRGYLWDWVRS